MACSHCVQGWNNIMGAHSELLFVLFLDCSKQSAARQSPNVLAKCVHRWHAHTHTRSTHHTCTVHAYLRCGSALCPELLRRLILRGKTSRRADDNPETIEKR